MLIERPWRIEDLARIEPRAQEREWNELGGITDWKQRIRCLMHSKRWDAYTLEAPEGIVLMGFCYGFMERAALGWIHASELVSVYPRQSVDAVRRHQDMIAQERGYEEILCTAASSWRQAPRWFKRLGFAERLEEFQPGLDMYIWRRKADGDE